MKKSIKINRSASGGHTTVTVTLVEDGITATYNYRSAGSRIGESVEFCTRAAEDMLKQVREEIDTRGEN